LSTNACETNALPTSALVRTPSTCGGFKEPTHQRHCAMFPPRSLVSTLVHIPACAISSALPNSLYVRDIPDSFQSRAISHAISGTDVQRHIFQTGDDLSRYKVSNVRLRGNLEDGRPGQPIEASSRFATASITTRADLAGLRPRTVEQNAEIGNMTWYVGGPPAGRHTPRTMRRKNSSTTAQRS